MFVFLTAIKQAIHKYRVRKFSTFEEGVLIDSVDKFEGMNHLTSGVHFLNSSIGYASYIGKGSIIKNTVIGRYTCIGPNVSVVIGKHPIEKFASIHPAFYSTAKQSGFTYVSKDKYQEFTYIDPHNKVSVQIGNDVWVGANSTIVEGVRIGDGAVIASGAVVAKDVPPYAIVGGVPAKVIKYRFDEQMIRKLLELKWWDKDKEWISSHADFFEDVEKLIINTSMGK